jgi:hypothetical protein
LKKDSDLQVLWSWRARARQARNEGNPTLHEAQTSFISGYGTGPIGYLILERVFNIFLVGAFFALLRHWTQSILPGAIAHSLVKGGVFTLPFCLAIFAGIMFWAHKRGEGVLSGITSNKGAA